MADIIQLLPDAIANQIAAGEVVQRPSSVVKELMENSLDAGSSEIKVIIKDSGKTLIQVIDNGVGMTETDARMAFERHATSKIRSSSDLFELKTMGFRGEALASISAVAQVELITRRGEDDLGQCIVVEGSELRKQEYCQALQGTMISVKNLFFNVPARRKFLKSDPVELKHIMDEFHRIALANPSIFFSLHHNGNEVYHLSTGNLRQRIINIFGKSYNEKIVPVEEELDSLKITGFVGKPEASKKTRGEQFIFVNNRYIKSNYLNHSIRSCYQELIQKEQHPFYVLFLEVDPGSIDVNVHPTKQEIKFEDERLIYNYIKVAVRHALGMYNVIPAIDFEIDYNMAQRSSDNRGRTEQAFRQIQSEQDRGNKKEWRSLYENISEELGSRAEAVRIESKLSSVDESFDQDKESRTKEPYQIHQSYILTQIKSGVILIDQQAAHERILYEKYMESLKAHGFPTQKQLFPETIQLNNAKSETLKSIRDKINMLGFDIEEFGGSSFIIHGIPVGLDNLTSGKELLESMLDQYESNLEFQLGINENLSRSLSFSTAVRRGTLLDIQEMKNLIDQLFACVVPYKSPSGKKTFVSMDIQDIKNRFND